MDFSRLHLYSPPQCVPENTGYTYALSSSYSSEALDFETEHGLDPVFDSPRMSRRSLRLVTAAYSTGDSQAVETHTCASGTASQDRGARTLKQRRSVSKAAFSMNHTSRRTAVSGADQSGSRSLHGAAALRPHVLDESLIREQTEVNHFWGLDDDGDVKGGGKATIQGNGDLAARAAEATGHNGYTCSDCSLLSERRDALTAHPTSRVYSRDRTQKPHASCYGSLNVTEFLGEDGHLGGRGASLCKDGEGTRRLETHAATHSQSSGPRRVAGTVGRLCACAGPLLVQTLQRVGAAGCRVSRTLWSVLWLALATPGKAASGVFWWLGIGWYQFVTLVSWLNVFLLTRCLRNICKFFLLLIPLLLFLGAGLSLWGQGGFLASLPVFSWPDLQRTQKADDPSNVFGPETSRLDPPPGGDDRASQWHWMSGVDQQMASLAGWCHTHDEQLRGLTLTLQKLQARVDRLDEGRTGLSSWVKDVVGQQLQEAEAARLPGTQADFTALHREHEVRISALEGLLGKLAGESEAIQRDLEQAELRTASGSEEQQRLLASVKHLELELSRLRAQVSEWQRLQSSCARADAGQGQVEAQVRAAVRLLLSEGQQDEALEQLLRRLSARFVSKEDLQLALSALERQVLGNISHHVAGSGQGPTPEAVLAAVSEAGISGITEAQAQVIVNNALKLYSQDKTGMVDFALESGGGSILSTRCSETYETKTALISLFGIPLWYFSQSPRVVIQPDIYPGNCWAFRGSQGYLVVRLSMAIWPATFTLEHIPKTLAPTGSIASAPKDFAVYGLENEYQEEGQLLGQFMYDQEGDSLQMFPVPERPDRTFQIVELRILSNWGHPEYTCLYRFRVHGEPAA
ncbi:SUN domain-containing protein 1 isoform X4 [Oryctolagus cuniculus]|uniref:SUN domain-containing protein 1 isoform X4 n=1 Tax=Oryctolagus cuniculus TaxID=9986 RepID=UPI002230DC13|nr:SUN domain-containing protein 1 isoform X1 [Oryctolagus cuniculus]XP_051691196.1 SUN domain-containing protein 1 isoform X1 [Oryctolagus cuniculus]